MNKIATIFLLFSTSFGLCRAQIIKNTLPEKLVVLTFDDATASQYSYVAPLLKSHGFGATFFICEFPPNFDDSSMYMNWQQISALNNWGFEIANHTRSHRQITKLSKKDFVFELCYIEQKCDSMDIPHPTTFAYPGYGLNKTSVEILKEKGYKLGRAGGSRVYNPKKDYPLLIPAWAATPDNEQEILDAFHLAKQGGIVVIIFHGVPDIEHPWVNTPPELFEKYIDYLSKNEFKVISMSNLHNYIDIQKAIDTIDPDFNLELKN
jgi:peptidoglycan/xylan/chitin deacetylase (PgdA/CDA1 family)